MSLGRRGRALQNRKMDIQEFAERVVDGTETSGTRQNICRKFMEIVYLYIINIAIKHSVLSGFLFLSSD